MTTATNYSDLSPAMKAALTSEISDQGWLYAGTVATVNALVRRGYAIAGSTTWISPRNFRLTDAGQRARTALLPPAVTDEDQIEQARREMDAAFAELERLSDYRDKLVAAQDALRQVFAEINQNGAAIGAALDAATEVTFETKIDDDAETALLVFGEIMACGCPTLVVRDEGHQEGCSERTSAMEKLAATLDIPNEILATPAGPNHFATAVATIDPTRPGWFVVGQGIGNYQAGVHHRVTIVERDKHGKVSAVAATMNNGYGHAYHWYGEHPQATAGLDVLEGPHVGLREQDRRRWPPNTASALHAVRNVMEDQILPGHARIAGETTQRPAHITVALPYNTEPTRHLELLRRYVPYHCTVEVARNYGTDIIHILPKKD